MKVLVLILLAIVFLSASMLHQAVEALPVTELRRRARGGADKPAHAIYKLAAYGAEADLLLWLGISLSAAGLILIIAASTWWLGLLTILLIAWLAAFGRLEVGGWTWKLASRLAPLVAWKTGLLQPILRQPARWLPKSPSRSHTKIYEKQDLLELLERQNRQTDNRFSPEEVKIIQGALTFGDKHVGSVMTPRKDVKLVGAGDPIGPHLMDELHASGLTRLPVAKEVNRSDHPEIVGTLYLKDLIGHQDKGRVRNIMNPHVCFINEEQNLRQALGVFLNNQCHLLIVVNSFEEFSGILSLEDLIEQILGEKVTDEFEQYNEPRAVATKNIEENSAQK